MSDNKISKNNITKILVQLSENPFEGTAKLQALKY